MTLCKAVQVMKPGSTAYQVTALPLFSNVGSQTFASLHTNSLAKLVQGSSMDCC